MGRDKGKENASIESTIVVISFATKRIEKKVLGDAMKASRLKHIANKKQRRTMVVQKEIPEDKLVDVEGDIDVD